MTNKQAFEIVLNLARNNTIAESDIMYQEQEQQYAKENEAVQIVEAYLDYDENIRED